MNNSCRLIKKDSLITLRSCFVKENIEVVTVFKALKEIDFDRVKEDFKRMNPELGVVKADRAEKAQMFRDVMTYFSVWFLQSSEYVEKIPSFNGDSDLFDIIRNELLEEIKEEN